MSEKLTRKQIGALPWMHVYGQYMPHDCATLRGTVAALTAVRNAIDVALKEGTGTAEVFASDGEGYKINVTRTSTFAQLGAPEYIYEKEFELGMRTAERDRKYRPDQRQGNTP